MRKQTYKISIVIPVYNEEENLEKGDVCHRLFALQNKLNNASFEYIFVDDGSKDSTLEKLKEIKQKESQRQITIVTFTRNFGAWAATKAGLAHSKGDVAFIQSIDGQEPPELLCDLLDSWQQGYDVVWLERKTREDNLVNRFLGRIYTLLMQKLAIANYPDKGIASPLLDKKVIHFVLESTEKSAPMHALLFWAGFKQTFVPYTRTKRQLGKSGWSTSKLFKMFIDSFVSFTFFPIRFFSVIGIILALIGFLWAFTLIAIKLMWQDLIQGYTSLIVTLLFFTGVQMIFLGVIGEYLWRILHEVKNRAEYIVEDVL